jgi:DNA (cytosine-5)-methyltransferase 1
MKIVSLFTGAGGLDKGFEAAGLETVWANEFDKDIWETFEKNFPKTTLDRRSIRDVPSDEIPDGDGIVGGPPCQSWSEAGALRGIKDKRGQLFFEFIRILRDKKPKFFLAENVSGMLAPRHKDALENIKRLFTESGYKLSFMLLNAVDYGAPQDRKRVFFIGIRNDLNFSFKFPKPLKQKIALQDRIFDIKDSVLPAQDKQKTNADKCNLPNHEYMIGGFSSMYMSRNRVRAWNEPSFTIQAGGRHAPLHPQAPKMTFIEHNKRVFVAGKESLYRRLSVRECARIQTFPDDFIFYYNNVANGYKMVGNAVPCNLAYHLAKEIKIQIIKNSSNDSFKQDIQSQAQVDVKFNATILIGYCQSKQRQWVEEKGLYNIRLDDIKQKETGVKFLLLRNDNKLKAHDIWRVIAEPKSMNNQDLINEGYQNPSCENYLVYNIEKVESNEFSDTTWNIEKLPSYKTMSNKYQPFSVTFSELSQAAV